LEDGVLANKMVNLPQVSRASKFPISLVSLHKKMHIVPSIFSPWDNEAKILLITINPMPVTKVEPFNQQQYMPRCTMLEM
jgi:hypothetical protein